MSTADTDTVRRNAAQQWRYERLMQMGFTEPASLELALGSSDLHMIKRALDHGCGHPLAYKIFR